ncbi:MAG: serine/threonine-protein phosphatase [Bacteroidia bacterium]|nr:MAG: serine/threonine-protein phosphatase [Bacteroidia bacterium]
MTAVLNITALTDVGKMRNKNEDNFILQRNIWDKENIALIGAIDGVGGYAGGAEAALLTKQTIENYLLNFKFGAPLQLLKDALIQANNSIHQKRLNDENLSRMSCVASVGLIDIDNERIYIAHVGDSRGYIFRNNQLLKITKDHSAVGMKEDSGYLTEEEAMHHPRRNEISKMLGEHFIDSDDNEQYLQIAEHSFLPHDIALFCSDGLTDLVNQQQLISILESNQSLEIKAQLLIDKANELGGKDNITVALAQFESTLLTSTFIKTSSTIEVPVQQNIQEKEVVKEIPVALEKKKNRLWLLIPFAFVLGFLANWNGSKKIFTHDEQAPVIDTLQQSLDSNLIKTDSIPDTLVGTTDTIQSQMPKTSHP